MQVELSRLTQAEVPVRGELALRHDLPESSGRTLAEDGVRFPAPFQVEGVARRSDPFVVVSGRISGRVELDCGRCLTGFRHDIGLAFVARFAEQSEAPRPASGDGEDDGIELESDDLDVSFLPVGATHVDVTAVVREQVLLDLPPWPQCRTDCAGLCAECGNDLNGDPCGCEPDPAASGDPRLAVLAELRKKLERS